MTKPRILLVEDSLETQILVRGILSDLFEVIVATSIANGKDALTQGPYDLVLLDVLLPDGSGFDICREMRATPQHQYVPVIFLTGKGDVTDKVQGFEIGGDDYLVKPFEPRELRARVDAHLKRRASNVGEFRAGPLRFELTKQRAFLMENTSERELDLTPNEFRILLHLARNTGRVLSRADILNEVWGEAVHVQDRTVDTHIYSVRKKLGLESHCVTAVPARGYRFDLSAS